MINDNSNINSISDGADFWCYQIGVIITVNIQEQLTKTAISLKIGENQLQ